MAAKTRTTKAKKLAAKTRNAARRARPKPAAKTTNVPAVIKTPPAKTRNAARSASSASLMTTTAIASVVIETSPAPEITWEDAVAEGKQLIATADRTDWRLAELADQVGTSTIYGDNTLAKFASEIGMSRCAIERRRTTYRNWKDILKADPGLKFSYSTGRALEKHPDRARLIQENPRMTKGQATALMKARSRSDTESETKRRWEDLLLRAGKAMADETHFKVGRDILLKVVKQKSLNYLREGIQAGIRLVDEFEKLFHEPAGDTSFDDAAP
jgi:hypothetical protein